MCAQKKQANRPPPKPKREAADRPEVKIPELYQIVIECKGEYEQEQVYDRMRKEGFPCRVLTL